MVRDLEILYLITEGNEFPLSLGFRVIRYQPCVIFKEIGCIEIDVTYPIVIRCHQVTYDLITILEIRGGEVAKG